MGHHGIAYRVCRSNRKIVSIDYAPENEMGAPHVEVYRVLFWDIGDACDYEFQKIADIYPNSMVQLENVVHCFGIDWQSMETFEQAIEQITADYYTCRNAGLGAYVRKAYEM